MELMYPIIIVICLIVAIAICFIKFDKKEKYINGKKIANTKYIKETEYYKAKIKKYKIVSNFIKVISVITICICSILIARPITEEITSEDKFNRDIFLSIDLSGSQNEVNLELVKKFRDIIPEIEGDRIGIVIFNTAPVVYCPLTDDYEFIDDCLKNIEYSDVDYELETKSNTQMSRPTVRPVERDSFYLELFRDGIYNESAVSKYKYVDSIKSRIKHIFRQVTTPVCRKKLKTLIKK